MKISKPDGRSGETSYFLKELSITMVKKFEMTSIKTIFKVVRQ
jgi:hypothetical protein